MEASEDQELLEYSAVFGKLVWLYTVSPLHAGWPIFSLRQWVLPPIRLGTFRIYHKGERPVGFVSWAMFNEETEQKFVRNPTGLKPSDWNSGERIWLIDCVAPFGDFKGICRDLKHEIFPNEIGRFLRYKRGTDTMRVMYCHGANARGKAQDRKLNPPVIPVAKPTIPE